MEYKPETQLRNITDDDSPMSTLHALADPSNEKIIGKINKTMGLAKKKINYNKSKFPFYLLVFLLLVFILVLVILRK